jgi:hypothetical protein
MMEDSDLLRQAADGMIGKMIAGKGDIKELTLISIWQAKDTGYIISGKVSTVSRSGR